VNAIERLAVLQGAAFYDELTAGVDERTFQILDRRRRTATVRGRGWLVRRMLLLADIVGLLSAALLAELVQAPVAGIHDWLDPGVELLLFLAALPLWVVAAKVYRLYEKDEERTDHSTADELAGVFHLLTVVVWLMFVGAWVTGLGSPALPKLALFWLSAIVFVTLGRAAARALCRRHIAYLQNAVIVGAGDVGRLVARKLSNHPEYGVNVVGFVDDAPVERNGSGDHLTVLGSPDRLPAIVRLFDIERVILAFSRSSHAEMLDLVRALKDLEVQIDIVPRLYEVVGPHVGIHTVEGLPLIGLPPLRLSRSSMLVKRALDLVLSLAALVVLVPLLPVVALLIKLDSPGPVFFRQVRMGSGGRTFRILKLRTMVVDADERKAEIAHLNKHAQAGGDPRMFKIAGDPRITRPGRVLRRFSLDELPQLVNVVRGEMSLVGPRPLILDEDRHVTEWARQRLTLKPGITGPWQVFGRSGIPFEEMVKLDYLYVTGWSLWGDISLILRTIPVLVRGDPVAP
jgi:exopolysaccharide biosynthesis polyprenyl glycosylphosphotransferase